MPEVPTFVDLGFARVDTDRKRRRGFPETILAQGKTPAEMVAIGRAILEKDGIVLATRASREQYDFFAGEFPNALYHERGRCITIEENPLPKNDGKIGVICGGTSDSPVAEEA